MNEHALVESAYRAGNLFFVATLPIIIGVSLAGIVVAGLQTATSIRDGASSYAVRLLVLLVIVYLLLPSLSESFHRFTRELWQA